MTTLSASELDRLLELAEKATPGPWYGWRAARGTLFHVSAKDVRIRANEVPRHGPDAAFIAACDPDTIRRLVAAAREPLDVTSLLDELAESPLPGARYAYEVVKRRLGAGT